MLALGSRLAARGHAVMLETWRRWDQHVEAAGMEFAPAPEYPVFPTRELALKPYDAVVLATPQTRRSLASFGPDVVVHDILTLAPALAAELEGVPVATLVPHLHPSSEPGSPPYSLGARFPRSAIGSLLWRSLQSVAETGLRRGRAELNEARARLGLPPVEDLHGGISTRLCIVGTFPQLEYPRTWAEEIRIVGPLIWEPPSVAVEIPPGDGPLVLIAPSTAHDVEQRLLRSALIGLAGEPLRVLAATNRKRVAKPPTIPANARLVDWISYGRTMPRCALVITHAGHGTVALALASGCPVLAVPHSGDMGENAARIDWAGVGVRLPWRFATPSGLRWAATRALGDSRLAGRARELARWAAGNDGAERAAELVEKLALGEP
ncbi:MAG: glycosyl transferase [Solirubrobacterales bacterium]|nr:glycosyl transferase [Solirubrobacterales bacterium]